MTKRQKLETTVAKILAKRYHSGYSDGFRDNKAECKLTFNKYWKMSSWGWMDAARGVIHLIERENN